MATSGSSSPSSPKRQRLPPPGTDMLMALPSDILDDRILSLLPFDKLVRTSCLSRAWRRRWESIKKLDIELLPAYSGGGRALWRCAQPVRGFRARVARRDVLRAARWLRALARKGVQDLSLEFSFGELRRLPGPALFSCGALVRLDLEKCTMPVAPRGFRGFPNLERLDLVYVTLAFTRAGTQLEHLIVAAENLAVLKLSLLYTTGVDTWAIRAPKLRELLVTMPMGVDIGCRIPLPLPMLEEATISFDRLLGTQDFLYAFQNISTVNKLCFINYQFNINMLEGITCKFENLREARLTIDFGQHSNVLSIVSLLKFAPHIEHLCIRTVYSKWEEDEIDEDPLNSEDEIDEDSLSSEDETDEDPLNSEDEIDEDSLSSEDEIDEDSLNSEDEIDEDSLNSELSSDLVASLKYVTLTNMKYNSNQMCFMKLLLSKARSLQTFDVTFVYDDESNERYGNACRELMECQKASPQVVLTEKLIIDG